MPDKIAAKIELEIQQIDQLLDSFGDLLAKARETMPDLVEMTAIASVLHSFYNGLENIFKTIAKSHDQEIPPGQGWHRQLLLKMAQPVRDGNPVLSQDLVDRFVEYLGFRHFFRHSYSTFLDWEKLGELVIPLQRTWEQTRRELRVFQASLSTGLSESGKS